MLWGTQPATATSVALAGISAKQWVIPRHFCVKTLLFSDQTHFLFGRMNLTPIPWSFNVGAWGSEEGHSDVLVHTDDYTSHRDVVLSISCRLSKRQICLLPPTPFSYLILSFSPFTSILLRSQQHSSAGSSSANPCKSYFFPKLNLTESGKLLQSVSVYEPTLAAQKILHCKIYTWL